MQYIDSVLNEIPKRLETHPLPKEIVSHALGLRNSQSVHEASVTAAETIGLPSELSPEDQYLFHTRIFGKQATKFALASYRSDTESLYNLSEADQSEVFAALSEDYANALTYANPNTLLTGAVEVSSFAHIPNQLVRGWVYDTRRSQLTLTDKLKSVISYSNVTPGTFPPKPYHINPISDNDITLVQAFGRDSVTDEELISIRTMQEKLKDNDTMMAYLDSTHFLPGPSNEALADTVAEQLFASKPIEQAVQWEVTYALYKNHPIVYKKYSNYIHTLWPHSGFYPTYEVKEDSVAIMDKIGLYNAQELAHPDMMARAVGILEKLGIQPDPLLADIPYDPESTQPHVRSAGKFLGREALARVEHVLRRRVRLL